MQIELAPGRREAVSLPGRGRCASFDGGEARPDHCLWVVHVQVAESGCRREPSPPLPPPQSRLCIVVFLVAVVVIVRLCVFVCLRACVHTRVRACVGVYTL